MGTRLGDQAVLGFLGNSREEPGNTSSGRKAAAVRREPRASLAERAPDTLSVQLFRRPAFLCLAPPRPTQPGPGVAAGMAVCSDLSALGLDLRLCVLQVVPCSPLVALGGAEVGSLCPGRGLCVGTWVSWAPGVQCPWSALLWTGLAPRAPARPW